MKNATFTVFCTLLIAQACSPYAFCQAPNPGSNGRFVSVQVLQTIDSTKAAAGTQFAGKIVNAVTTPQGTIQAGAAAVMRLEQNAVAGANTWTLALISPVTGKEASIGGVAGAAAGVGGQITNQLSGLGLGNLGSFGKKKPAANNAPATATGGKVYFAANAQVRFLLDQAPSNTSNTGATVAPPAQVSQVQTQPAAFSAPQNAVQPAPVSPAPAPGVPAPAPGVPGNTAQNGFGRPGAPPSTGQAGSSPGQAGSSTVVWGNVRYVLQGCQRQAPHIICQVQLTNLAAGDANLITNGQTYFVDQSGNKVGLNGASVANCNLLRGCLALSNLAMTGNFEFLDEDSKSLTLVRFQIQTRTGPVQFTNVQVQ